MRYHALLLLTLLLTGCSHDRELSRKREAYRTAAKAVETHRRKEWLVDGSPAAKEALRSQWAAMQQFAGLYLDAHPGSSAAELQNAMTGLLKEAVPVKEDDFNGSAEAIRLQPGLWLIAASRSWEGNVFLLRKTWRGYRLVWDVATSFPPQQGDKDRRHDWSLDAATEACRDTEPHFCGPLTAHIGLLPATADGHARFYLAGNYAAQFASQEGGQTSIWRVTERGADLLWIKHYASAIDAGWSERLRGDTLQIAEKTQWKTMFGCGMCNGRLVLQQVRLTATGIEDLGEMSVDPALDEVDDLLYRIHHGEDVSAAASPAVVRVLRAVIHNAADLLPQDKASELRLGLMEGRSEQQSGNQLHLCLSADELGTVAFEAHRAGAHWFWDRAVASQSACPDKLEELALPKD